jgi:hypothetical protein
MTAPELHDLTHAFFLTLGTLARACLSVFVAATTDYSEALHFACLLADRRFPHRHFVHCGQFGMNTRERFICTASNASHEKAKEAEAWHQFQRQQDSGFRSSQAKI